ncbi:selenium cofactor biosynthesis protein YqeC [Proteiniborus sp. MB09-C3]|uniref:selenium cofactor biosynthesis protein YqeC n=1 Tax=Proteiniborus sp. MB09-C3 TaxID=3050072 RepID=UPI00255467F2|nr:selenium cofactor biosynthesis protein YqeC [Proteiniborus sp. MB09-C3]WIV12548.1 selenium cofactor biosynthesis protein YqeC [Proteiniborus sp. MB09-C3]
MSIIKYFDIDIGTREMISVVGGGGKTTTIFKLASELKQLDMRVLVTTTTAIYNPSTELYDDLVVLEDGQSIENGLKNGTITVLGRCISPQNKLLGVDSGFLDTIYNEDLFDFILIEADGSKGRPIKAPASHEPVIPSNTSKVIGVIGIEALGKVIDEANVHRPEIFCEVTNSRIGDVIIEEIIVKLVMAKDGLFKGASADSKKYLLFNKADNEMQMRQASLIGKMIRNKGLLINGLLAGSMANKRIKSV